ncbi:MAG: hypothetical protein QOK17_809 [Sphingomonadales bacterium]|nr:hypothetical protein [Sphingomonadales bacterium]
MARGKLLLAAALGSAIAAPASAQAANPPASDTRAQDRATNEKMLEVLLARRAAVVSSNGNAEGKRAALDFLDRQIAKVRAELGA